MVEKLLNELFETCHMISYFLKLKSTVIFDYLFYIYMYYYSLMFIY